MINTTDNVSAQLHDRLIELNLSLFYTNKKLKKHLKKLRWENQLVRRIPLRDRVRLTWFELFQLALFFFLQCNSISLLVRCDILPRSLRAVPRKRYNGREIIQSSWGRDRTNERMNGRTDEWTDWRTRAMTSGKRTASFLVERFRVLSRESISGRNARHLRWRRVFPSASLPETKEFPFRSRAGIVSNRLPPRWRSYDEAVYANDSFEYDFSIWKIVYIVASEIADNWLD